MSERPNIPPISYVDCTIPPGVTLAEYRRARAQAARPSLRARLVRRIVRARRRGDPLDPA